MTPAAGLGEVVDDTLDVVDTASSTSSTGRPGASCRCPALSIATGVSSACSTWRSSSTALSASTSGCKRTPQTPTHSPSVERGIA